jgi:serine/threonine-protein kinase
MSLARRLRSDQADECAGAVELSVPWPELSRFCEKALCARAPWLYSKSNLLPDSKLMQPRVLGPFCLVRPLDVPTAVHRLFLANRFDDTTPESRAATLPHAQAATQAPTHVIKLLPPRGDETGRVQRARFLHERQLLHALNHPCIPSLEGYGESDGVLFYASDYIEGVNLAQLLGHDALPASPANCRRLPKEIAVYILAQIADALDHLHDFAFADENGNTRELNGVHRDLCPANIFLSKDGNVILGDYDAAISCLLAPEIAAFDAGHVAYKAPERLIGGKEAGPKSDLFALAVVLWEMLKGERCFAGETEVQTLDAIVRFDINHSSRKVSGLSSKLSEVLRRNLDRDPERRFDDAYQVLQRLAQSPEAAHAEAARAQLGQMVSHEWAQRQAPPVAE